MSTKRQSRNYDALSARPLPDGRGSESDAEPRPSGSGGNSGFVTGTKRQSTRGRRYPKRPILGVGAVILRGDRVVLVQRGREPLKGYWSLPGGVLEVGETLERAVVREAREETGQDIVPRAVVGVSERLMLDERGRPEYHYVLIEFLCRVRAGALTPGGDALDARWERCGDLSRYRLTEGALEAIEKALKLRKEMRAK